MTPHGHNRPSRAQAAAVVIIVAVVVGPMAGLAGVVLTGSARQEGAIAVAGGVIQVGKASVKWPDVRVAVNDSADRAAAEPDALHLANGEVWTGKIAKAGGGQVTLVSALLGSRVVKTAELQAIDFVPGLPAPTAAKTGRLYRVKGRPVDGDLVWIEADRAAVDTALGAVAMDRKLLQRYVFASKPQQPAPSGDGLEPARSRTRGTAAVPHPVSVLRPGRGVELPTLSTKRGYLSRSAVQHCELYATYDDDRAGV